MAENYENSPNLITEDVLALESVVSELEAIKHRSESAFHCKQSEELEKTKEKYEKELRLAKNIICELEQQVLFYQQEKLENERLASAAVIKDKAEGETENIDPNIHSFKIQRIEALIKSEIDEDIQSMTYKNQLNENHIQKLEKELDLSNLDLNLMRKNSKELETKARIYEIRTKELADEKSVLQEELKLITTVRDTLAEHNHRLLEETQLKDKQIKALQEKVEGFKGLNSDLEKDMIALISRIKALESEKELLYEQINELRDQYETKLKLLKDSQKLVEFLKNKDGDETQTIEEKKKERLTQSFSIDRKHANLFLNLKNDDFNYSEINDFPMQFNLDPQDTLSDLDLTASLADKYIMEAYPNRPKLSSFNSSQKERPTSSRNRESSTRITPVKNSCLEEVLDATPVRRRICTEHEERDEASEELEDLIEARERRKMLLEGELINGSHLSVRRKIFDEYRPKLDLTLEVLPEDCEKCTLI